MIYLKETIYLLSLFWFKPLTFHRRFDVANVDPLYMGKWLNLWNRNVRENLLFDPSVRRPFLQIILGQYFLFVLIDYILRVFNLNSTSNSFFVGTILLLALLVMGGLSISSLFGLAPFFVIGMVASIVASTVFSMTNYLLIIAIVGCAIGKSVSITYALTVGSAVSKIGGSALSLALGLALGFASGTSLGVDVGISFGVILSSFILMSLFRLVRYPMLFVWSLLQHWLVRISKSDLFAYSPFAFDDLIYFPLPFFNRFLINCMKVSPSMAGGMVTSTASSVGQKWAIVSAGSWWGAQSGLSVSRLADLEPSSARLAQMSSLIADVPSWPRRRAKETSQLLADFSAVALSLANLEMGTLVPQTRLYALERNRTEIETLKARAGIISRPELADMGTHWQRLIREHAQEVEQMESRIITGAYQAGSALETGSQLFQGRTDLFKITGEVYADPNRAETLLLIGQQRMGKSSALYQMSDRIPDLHMMFVDCQGAFTGKGDELFAAGLTEAIMRWEKRRPGGIRMEPLDIATIEKHPLHHLSIWLDAFADQTQGKRVLLCLDEFDKLVRFVAEGRFSWDVLGKLRGLSQSPGWMVLYSGQFELDAYSQQLSEYIKNVRRVRVSYLKKDEARKLLEEPVPEFGLVWEPEATEAAMYWTGCQPFLAQLVGTEIVNRMVELNRTDVTAADVEAVIPAVLDSGDYYFKSIDRVLDVEDKTDMVLREIAEHGRIESEVRKGVITRLISQEYIETDGRGHRFRVPLLREWWLRKIADQ